MGKHVQIATLGGFGQFLVLKGFRVNELEHRVPKQERILTVVVADDFHRRVDLARALLSNFRRTKT